MKKAALIAGIFATLIVSRAALAQPAPGYYAPVNDSRTYNIGGTFWSFTVIAVNGGQEVWGRGFASTTNTRYKWVPMTSGGIPFYAIQTTVNPGNTVHTCFQVYPNLVAVIPYARPNSLSMCGGVRQGSILIEPAGADIANTAQCPDWSGLYEPWGNAGGASIRQGVLARADNFDEYVLVLKATDVGGHPATNPVTVGNCGNGPGSVNNLMWLKVKPSL